MPADTIRTIADALPSVPAASPVSEAARIDAERALAPNTRRSYASALSRLEDWLDGRELSDAVLAAYIRDILESGLAVATARQTLSALSFTARLAGRPNPAGPETMLVMRAFGRQAVGRGRGRVTGISWRMADAAAELAAVGPGPNASLRNAALIALASDCLLRVSEMAAVRLEDLETEADGSGRLTVRRSKTDQEGMDETLFVGKPAMDRVRAWIEAAGIAEGPLFLPVNKGDAIGPAIRPEVGMSLQAVRAVIKQCAAAIGIEGASGHSFRIGSVRSLAEAGASLAEMQAAGRWRDPQMPARYVKGQVTGRSAVARLRHGVGDA